MSQLSSTALTAFKIYRWLIEHQDRLVVPLTTCRLCLSPSAAEIAREPQIAGLVDTCTRDNFRAAVRDWRIDASTHEDNVTFFYFAGHGVQRSPGDSVLLLEDFGDGLGPTLDKAVSTKDIYYGMAVSDFRPNMARTQFSFVDACRVYPSEFEAYELMHSSTVWDVERGGGVDDRRAPIFYAALPGDVASARKVDQTFFSKALLACLEGGAARAPDEETGESAWTVSYQSLSEKLDLYFSEMCPDQAWRVDGAGSDAVIVRLDSPPSVQVAIGLAPDSATTIAQIRVLNDRSEPIWELSPPITPNPYTSILPAGFYQFSAIVHPPRDGFINDGPRLGMVMPPRFKRTLKVTP